MKFRINMLFERFQDFFINRCRIHPGQKFVLAVSGGIDSVVMLHLFKRSGMECAVAHCNFQLRDEASLGDEDFVRDLAGHTNFLFHNTRFATQEFATTNQISIQMAARQLRYEWLEKLVTAFNYDAIAVAHHANDVAETMLLNLVKGTGLAGMHGIRAVHGKVIRPLLFATKNELVHYAEVNQLSWREDASNAELYYQRNLIRNKVIPVLEQINPRVTGAMMHHARLMQGYEAIVEKFISELERNAVSLSTKGGFRTIDLEKVNTSPAPA
ncbi:MAG: tRNA lysidine(34) synthetase TilS, partial [Bacteroidota bacterium]|nr:tRNA lysidine(34) synthetase TilS [Bacteroidota bacterium]